MKTILRVRFLVSLFLFTAAVRAQSDDMPVSRAIQLEELSEKNDAEPEDDAFEISMQQFKRNPLNMNIAGESELLQLHQLNILQITSLIRYRQMLGPFLTICELQAVPGWDPETIRYLLPYIYVGQSESPVDALSKRWEKGDASFLLRASQIMEKSKGYEKPQNPDASYYMGSPQHIFIRYLFTYHQLMSFGFTGDKDSGEPFFRSAQRYGFDFYSFHIFIREMGIVKALALGDFTVNFGQGLTQWQTFSFTKTSQAMSVCREAETILPYHSAGEYNFHRGLGICLQQGSWQSSLFISNQKISTNQITDTTGRDDVFSSIENGGYHRTPAEIADRNNSRQFSAGGNIRYHGKQFGLGLNVIHFQFSRSFEKNTEPYNQFGIHGRSLSNLSLDYQYTFNNVHVFGESAIDQRFHIAVVQGALISLAENIDLSFLYRNISSAYQSLYANAFTENTSPNNEKGFYSGLALKPFTGWHLDLYYDLYQFPWLKYRIDAPSAGRDILVHLTWQPNKFSNLSALYKNEKKGGNDASMDLTTHAIATIEKQRWRFEMDQQILKTVSTRVRTEFIYLRQAGFPTQRGFLGSGEMNFKMKGFLGNFGFMLFETDQYDSRIYAYEPDLLYAFSLPAFYGRGLHYYINLHGDISRFLFRPGKCKVLVWLKWGQIFYDGVNSIGSGLDEIAGNKKSELKAQFMVEW